MRNCWNKNDPTLFNLYFANEHFPYSLVQFDRNNIVACHTWQESRGGVGQRENVLIALIKTSFLEIEGNGKKRRGKRNQTVGKLLSINPSSSNATLTPWIPED